MADEAKPGRGGVIAGGVVIAGAIAALFWFGFRGSERAAGNHSEAPPQATEGAADGSGATTEIPPGAQPASIATEVASSAATPAPPGTPSFDVVRVEPDGGALIAGTALPGARVSVEVDGTVMGEAVADAGGGFAALFDIPPAQGSRIVVLLAEDGQGGTLRSAETVIVARPPAPQAATAREGGEATVAATPDADGMEASVSAAAGVTATEVPTVLRADPGGIDLMQAGHAASGGASDQVTIDLISYDGDGGVRLEGRFAGEAAGALHLYLDNALLGDGVVTARGTWQAALPPVAPGLYTLRVDQTDPAGKVVSRFETPFKREEPEELAALAADPAEGALLAMAITVQPGSSLWRIAADRYGEGTRYVQIFEANREQIRDPDLIYPGQVFALPEEAGATAAD